ncbi:MAG: tetratricopeptide repeat protein [Flavobacteriales bacterium]|nr:tetratricopeptide repeat protein [Flavobacteriales bacterium]
MLGIYGKRGAIQKQTEYYFKSLKIDEETGNKAGIVNSLNNIGFIHYYQGDIPKALECYSKSLKIKEELGNRAGILYCSLKFVSKVFTEDFVKHLSN